MPARVRYPGSPPGRYGEPSRSKRLGLTAAIVALATLFFGWVLWAALGAAAPDVSGALVGFETRDGTHSAVKLAVEADKAKAVACRVNVVDRNQQEVATTQIVVPAGSSDRREVVRVIRTRGRGVAASLSGCQVVAH